MSPEAHSRDRSGLARRTWRGLLLFLEIIGLRQPSGGDPETRLKALRLRYFQFRDLLSANSDLLAVIAGMETRIQSGAPSGNASVKAQALQALTAAHRMASSLNTLSEGKYPAVMQAYQRIQRRIAACFAEDARDAAEWVVPLERVDRSSAAWAGHKMANLGEIPGHLGLPVPPGFVVTTTAYRLVVDAAGVADLLHRVALAATDSEAEAAAKEAQVRFQGVSLPSDLVRSLEEAHQALAPAGREPPPLAVRSSALLEDTEVSFAGQFATLLNVRAGGLPDAYRTVLASLYAPQAVHYRLAMGIPEPDVAIAVGCLAMVDALCSGVVYSRDPMGRSDDAIIHAIWGLGPLLVEGRVRPQVYRLAGDESPRLHSRSLSDQSVWLRFSNNGGVCEEPLPGELAPRHCLSDEEAETLASWTRRLESHFGAPQDVEWALGRDGRLLILQSRPLRRVPGTGGQSAEPPAGAVLLLEGGETAMRGCGAGPVCLAEGDTSPENFPDGGVLVAAHSSPGYIRALRRASAVITESGSALGHMASLARELGVPALLGASGAMRALQPGRVVTVDAERGRVYDGRLDSLLDGAPPARAVMAPGAGDTLLKCVASYVVPLSLTDPRDPSFTPLNCTTLHDLARYVHERSFEEMFSIHALVGDVRRQAPVLDVFLPVDLYVLDLGGGLDAPQGARRVKRAEIASPLLKSLIDGMLHRDIPRSGPRAMDAGGFFQVVMRHGLTNPEDNAGLRDPSFAIVSDRYLNVASRVGYHFSAVDAYCGDFVNENYITFRFKGGAADRIRRERRVRAIGQILRAMGFAVSVTDDLVVANFQKQPPEALLAHLEMLGRLLQFMRQMDAAMASDAWVDRVVQAFLDGDYGLSGTPDRGK